MEITLMWTFVSQLIATLCCVALLTWGLSLPLVGNFSLFFTAAWIAVAIYGAVAQEGYVAPLATLLAGLSLWLAVRAYRLIEKYGTPASARA